MEVICNSQIHLLWVLQTQTQERAQTQTQDTQIRHAEKQKAGLDETKSAIHKRQVIRKSERKQKTDSKSPKRKKSKQISAN